jgi:hypothetical protein
MALVIVTFTTVDIQAATPETAGETIVAGELVYKDSSTNKIKISSNAAAASNYVHGTAITGGILDQTILVAYPTAAGPIFDFGLAVDPDDGIAYYLGDAGDWWTFTDVKNADTGLDALHVGYHKTVGHFVFKPYTLTGAVLAP